jgi:hypothetical protein
VNCEEALAVLCASLDGEAARKELAAARRHLAGCESCRAEFAIIRRTENLLTAERERREVWGAGPRRARRVLGWTAIAAAAALLLAAAGTLWLRGDPNLPGVTAVRGEVLLGERPAQVGDSPGEGESLVARGRGSALVVEYEDGTALTLGGDSELICVRAHASGRSYRLKRGRVLAEVTPGSGGLEITAAAGRVEVLGTIFEVQLGKDASAMSVAVARGAVRLTSARHSQVSQTVRAGLGARLRAGQRYRISCSPLKGKDWQRLLGREPVHADPHLAAPKIPAGTWVPRDPDRNGRTPGGRCYLRMVYSQAHGGGLLFGGQEGRRDTSLWCYEAKADRWRQVAPGRRVEDHAAAALFPESRNGHALAALPGGEVVLVGGAGRFGPQVVWRFAAGRWSNRGKSSYWPLYAASCIVPDSGKLYVFGVEGGMPYSCFCYYDTSGGKWQKLPSSTPMPRRRTLLDNYMCWDSRRKRLLLQRFPARGDPSGTRAETWAFDPGAGKWERLRPAAQPSVRGHGAMDYSPQADAVLLYGGDSRGGETWVYSCAVNRWEQLTPAGNPPPRTRHALYYDPSADLFVVYGGSGDRGYLGDVWVFRLAPTK